MELRQLRYFVAVAEEMHFNRAAQRLRIAQPALSQQIRRLENELKATLLNRTTRSVELTDPGRVLLAEARRVLADADYALAAVQHASQGEAGLLRIGFVSSAALHVLPALALSLQKTWPNVSLQLQEGTTDEQIDLVRNGLIDVGIVREAEAPDGLVVQQLTEEPLVLALPTEHDLAQVECARLAQLRDERFIVFPRQQVPRLYDHIAALLHRAGTQLNVAQEAIQFPTMLGLVAARRGVAVVPDSMRALQLPGVRYIPIADEGATSKVYLVADRTRATSPLVRNCFVTAEGLHLS